jgi:SAM-dependent methyltransferase
MSADEISARRLLTLQSILACPTCSGELVHLDRLEREGIIVSSTISCNDCGVIGVVRGFRPSFHLEDLGDGWMPAGQVESVVDLRRLTTVGSWTHVAEGLLGDGAGASVSGVLGAGGIVIEFVKHSWSGTVTITGAGQHVEIDLLSDEFEVVRVTLDPPDVGDAIWTAQLGEVGHQPGRNQMIVRRVWQLEPVEQVAVPHFEPSNAGNPYPPRFEELLAMLPPDAVVVDVGGGDRRHPDPRVLNFEYMKFDRPDFFGSGLQLPIRSGSVDLVLSQAVIEHVPEPQRAVDEIGRILRPSGVVYCEIAFMQPLHAVPYHFFNVTPHGATLLFDNFDTIRAGSAGGLEDTMRWIFRLVEAERVIGSEEVTRVLGAMSELDRSMPADTLDHVASFVFVEAAAR